MHKCVVLPSRILFTFVLPVLAVGSCLSQQSNTLSAEKQAEVATTVENFLRDSEVPSVQIGVIEHGKIVYTAAFGKAQLDPTVEATTAMPYGIGSVSKQFTAAATMVLVEKGKIKLDDPVSTWLPDLAHSKEITLRNLLNQVSGYEDYYTEDYPIPQVLHPVDPYEFAKEWTSHPLNFKPGTQWQYSNTNYLVVSLIVQKVSGMPFFDFLQQAVLRPAGLSHVINLDGANVPAIPQGYLHFAFGPPRPAPAEGRGTLSGAGQLAMPIGDLMIWDEVILHKSAVLKPEHWELMEAPLVLPNGKSTGYGMGFTFESYDGMKIVGHTGGLTGFATIEELYPEVDGAVAIIANSDRAAWGVVSTVRRILNAPPTSGSNAAQADGQSLLKTALEQLEQGHIDRRVLAPNLSFYLTPQAVADYQSSLASLGTVSRMENTYSVERGGMHGLSFIVTGSSGKKISAFIYVTTDGKLDQLVLHKIGS